MGCESLRRGRRTAAGTGARAALAAALALLLATAVGAASYEYDALGRLTQVTYDNGAFVSYTYDSNGNRTQVNAAVSSAQFSVNDVSAAEGSNLVFTVTKSGATAASHSVSYATAHGTAQGSDYTAASGQLTFAPSETTKTVTVATTADANYESAESMVLNLSSATNGATISDSQGVGTITNTSSGPAFSINDVSVTEGGNLVFTVTKTGQTALAHNVSYATANGTATAGSDYTATSGALSFAWNEATKTVTVSTIQDTTVESSETLVVNLSSATNGSTISDSQGGGTITDDDSYSPPYAVINGISYGCGYDGPDGSGNYWVYHCLHMSAYDPDGGTAYFYNSSYPSTYYMPIGYTVYNIYVPGYEYTSYYSSFGSVYIYDTTGGNRTYSIGGSHPSYYLYPVVLDLDGDGVELISALLSSVHFDVDGDGVRERVGWVGADDGLLVLDRDGDGRITTGAEISFVQDLPGARTDLEGLRAFDVNADGRLDEGDPVFADLRVWRDADQDGVSAADELFALADFDIVAIDLSIAPTGASAEGAADNVITGLARFVRGDGSDGVVADASFLYQDAGMQLEAGPALDIASYVRAMMSGR